MFPTPKRLIRNNARRVLTANTHLPSLHFVNAVVVVAKLAQTIQKTA